MNTIKHQTALNIVIQLALVFSGSTYNTSCIPPWEIPGFSQLSLDISANSNVRIRWFNQQSGRCDMILHFGNINLKELAWKEDSREPTDWLILAIGTLAFFLSCISFFGDITVAEKIAFVLDEFLLGRDWYLYMLSNLVENYGVNYGDDTNPAYINNLPLNFNSCLST